MSRPFQQHTSNAGTSYYPFAPNWHADTQWRREIARSPRAVRRALAKYRELLDDKTIYTHDWRAHPIVADYKFNGNRWRMLETGIALAQFSESNEFRRGLLNPAAYPQTCAELRSCLLLQQMRFSLVREPSNQRGQHGKRKRKGPDWLALRGSTAYGVEVKCPHVSDDYRARQELITHVATSLHGYNQQLELTLNPAMAARYVHGGWPDLAGAETAVVDALQRYELDGEDDTILGKLSTIAGPYAPMIGPIHADEVCEASKLRDLLQSAASQLSEFQPGIVVIDTSLDAGLRRRCCQIAAAMNEPWASHLACTLLVADTYPGFVMTVIPGPQFTEAPGGRVCGRGHVHVDTFPNADCTLDTRFEDPPAFCVHEKGHFAGR